MTESVKSWHVGERVFYADNGPDDTGTIIRVHKTEGIRVLWDNDIDGTNEDDYWPSQLGAFISL